VKVKYLNKGMELFGNSEVIPCHYVCFTLFSIVGTSLLYHEFSISTFGVCSHYIKLHFFGDGCALTFFGVYLITSNRTAEQDADKHGDEEPADVGIDKRSHISVTEVHVSESERSDVVRVGDVVELHVPRHSSPPPVVESISEEQSQGSSPPRVAGAPLGHIEKRGSAQRLHAANAAVSSMPRNMRLRSPSDAAPSPFSRVFVPASSPESRFSAGSEAVEVQGRETRPSVSVLLSELVPDVKGVGIGGTRASRVSSAVALLGAFAGGAHGATFMFDPTEREKPDELERQATLRASFARNNQGRISIRSSKATRDKPATSFTCGGNAQTSTSSVEAHRPNTARGSSSSGLVMSGHT